MYKDYRFINAGTNEYYRWGKKALLDQMLNDHRPVADED